MPWSTQNGLSSSRPRLSLATTPLAALRLSARRDAVRAQDLAQEALLLRRVQPEVRRAHLAADNEAGVVVHLA
eukprot:7378047-Prymnesium_polylepis.1